MDKPSEAVFDAIRDEGNKALAAAERDHAEELGGVNWAHLGVTDVLFCHERDGGTLWRVLIEEASPECGLAQAVYEHLVAAFPNTRFDVATEW